MIELSNTNVKFNFYVNVDTFVVLFCIFLVPFLVECSGDGKS